MSEFRKSVGERLRLKVSRDGYLQHDYGYGCELEIRRGWNDGCQFEGNYLSIDDLKDLRYLIDRALEHTHQNQKG